MFYDFKNVVAACTTANACPKCLMRDEAVALALLAKKCVLASLYSRITHKLQSGVDGHHVLMVGGVLVGRWPLAALAILDTL
jgi:hypothetical protein